MTIDRSIEIMDTTHREHYDSIESVNEACRMGMEALKAQRDGGWISVKDRLPDDNERVIAFRPNEAETSAYRYCVMWGWAVRIAFRHGITNWMPLPEPPKEVGQDE